MKNIIAVIILILFILLLIFGGVGIIAEAIGPGIFHRWLLSIGINPKVYFITCYSVLAVFIIMFITMCIITNHAGK